MFVVIISILVVLVIIIVVAAAVVFTSGSSQDDKDASAIQTDQAAPAAPPTAPSAQAAQDPAKKLVWRRFRGIDLVYGDTGGPRRSAPDGRVTFAGDTNNPSQCQKWCEQDPKCLGYTHTGDKEGEWSNQCYLVKSYDHTVAVGNSHNSGWKYYV
jgi:PAN domain.